MLGLAVGLEGEVAEDRARDRLAADGLGDGLAVEALGAVGGACPYLQRRGAQRRPLVRRLVVRLAEGLDEGEVLLVAVERRQVGKIDVGRDDAGCRVAGDPEHRRQDGADGADEDAVDGSLAILLDQRRHAGRFGGVDGDHGVRLGLLHIGEADAEVGLLERELFDHDLFPRLADRLEVGFDHGLRAVAVGVVLGQEADALGRKLVRHDIGDHRAVLAVRAVEPDRIRIDLAGEDRVGLGDRRDVQDVGTRQHRLHGERHRAVPAFDHHRHLLGHHLVGARHAHGGRAFVILADHRDLAAHDAAFGVDLVGDDLDGMQYRLAVGTGRTGERNDHADLDRLALREGGHCQGGGTRGRRERELTSSERDAGHGRYLLNERLFSDSLPARRPGVNEGAVQNESGPASPSLRRNHTHPEARPAGPRHEGWATHRACCPCVEAAAGAASSV